MNKIKAAFPVLGAGLLYLVTIGFSLHEELVYAKGSGTGGGYALPWKIIFGLYGLLALGIIILVILIATGKWNPMRLLDWVKARVGKVAPWVLFLAGTLFLEYILLVHRYSVHLLKPWTRWMILLPWLALCAYLLPGIPKITLKGSRPTAGENFLINLAMTGLIFGTTFAVFLHFSQVSNYPFLLTWSEGNRFYDYSLIFGRSIYQPTGSMDTPYFSPGRYGLWGFLFLFPNLPIIVHRAWDAFLWSFTPFLFSFAASMRLRPRWLRVLFILWGGLFIMQGPTYPMILIAGFLVLIVQTASVGPREIPIALGSLYASVSRWTWMFMGGYWAALVELLEYYPRRVGSQIKRLLPFLISAGTGAVVGVGAYLAFFDNSSTVDLPLNQPLLWYRLLPNPTYQYGIITSILLAAGAPVLLLFILWRTHKWKLDGLQALAVFGGLAATAGVGAIISAKIGGGSNLHNLDMFLCSVVLISALALTTVFKNKITLSKGMHFLIALSLLAPMAYTVQNSRPLRLPAQNVVDSSLKTIQDEVAGTVAAGQDVLFMDDRQLVAFGYIKNIPFHPEYEKKVLMDMAMASDGDYFKPFYADLQAHRYALIISEPVNTSYKLSYGYFSEENNAWTVWVAAPLLCYYRVQTDLTPVDVQLLVPRETPCSDWTPPAG